MAGLLLSKSEKAFILEGIQVKAIIFVFITYNKLYTNYLLCVVTE